MEATTRDLRLRAAELLAATDRGEEVIITYRGQRRAKLVRYVEADRVRETADTNNASFGMWKDRELDVDATVRELRQGRTFR